MPKSKLSEYDNTAANNTDVGGVNTAEGMSPADVNDAIRELMSHLADFADGTEAITAIDVAGTVTADGITTGGNIFFDSTSGAMRFRTDGGTEKATIRLATNDLQVETSSLERLRITAAGRLGLGTSSPTQEIHGYSSGGDFSLRLESASATGTAYTYYKNADQEYAVGIRGTASDTFQIIDYTADTTRLAIDTSGNVGIGTASPNNYSGYTVLTVNNATNGGVIEVAQNDVIKGQFYYDGTATHVRANTGTDLILDTNGAERMRILSSGESVGIGTSSPSGDGATLHLDGSGANSTLHLTNSTTGGGAGDGTYVTTSANNFLLRNRENGYVSIYSNNTERMRITSGGGVYIGDTSSNMGANNFIVAKSTSLGNRHNNTTGGGSLTELSGTSLTPDGTNWYGSYGQLRFHSNSSYTSNARRFLITNGLATNKFAIIQSTGANTDPDIEANGGHINNGNPTFVIHANSHIGIKSNAAGVGYLTGPRDNVVTVADDSTVTLHTGTVGAWLVHIYNTNAGDGAVYFVTYAGAPVLVASRTTSIPWATTDTDGSYCLTKVSNGHTCTFKNRSGASKNFVILVTGAQTW